MDIKIWQRNFEKVEEAISELGFKEFMNAVMGNIGHHLDMAFSEDINELADEVREGESSLTPETIMEMYNIRRKSGKYERIYSELEKINKELQKL